MMLGKGSIWVSEKIKKLQYYIYQKIKNSRMISVAQWVSNAPT